MVALEGTTKIAKESYDCFVPLVTLTDWFDRLHGYAIQTNGRVTSRIHIHVSSKNSIGCTANNDERAVGEGGRKCLSVQWVVCSLVDCMRLYLFYPCFYYIGYLYLPPNFICLSFIPFHSTLLLPTSTLLFSCTLLCIHSCCQNDPHSYTKKFTSALGVQA